jgi:hypothetical protein
MKAVLSLFNTFYFKDKIITTSYKPKTFEKMKFYGAYVLYETKIPKNLSDPAVLYVPDPRDRVLVYVKNVSIPLTYTA